MRTRNLVGSATLAVALLLAMPTPASAAHHPTVKLNFDCDSSGWRPNGWESNEKRGIHFSDSLGADLQVGNFGIESRARALGVFSDDPSYLIMDIDGTARCIDLWFGGDDPSLSKAGDRAVLALYLAGQKVGQASVLLNRNNLMDQQISLCGISFDRATFLYDVSTSGMTEIVDDIILQLA